MSRSPDANPRSPVRPALPGVATPVNPGYALLSMVRRWREFEYRDRLSPLRWASTNPLFSAAAVIVVGIVAAVIWVVSTSLSSPRKYVVVEAYELDRSVERDGVRIALRRVTYQPGFDIRTSQTLRAEDPGAVFIDGIMTNDGPESVLAFVATRPPVSVAPRSAAGTVRASDYPVRSLGAPGCTDELGPHVVLPARQSYRFSQWIPAGESSAWVARAVRGGELPALELGSFVRWGGDCASLPGPDSLSWWRVFVPSQDLPAVELRDYYPFGAPTALEFGLNGRRYWTDWLPRVR